MLRELARRSGPAWPKEERQRQPPPNSFERARAFAAVSLTDKNRIMPAYVLLAIDRYAGTVLPRAKTIRFFARR